MAKIQYISIENFKGIQQATVEFEGEKSPGRFITLIGLNESGKTTLLEALSHSILSDLDTTNLMKSVQGKPELNDLIPRDEKAAFNGSVNVSTRVGLDQEDIAAIEGYISSIGYVCLEPISSVLNILRAYDFTDSSLTYTWNRWDFRASVRKKRGNKRLNLSYIDLKDDWLKVVAFIRSRLPYIVYFPTFLVNFPTKIYLEGKHGDVDKYYRDILNDALRSLSSPLNIDQHILSRVRKHRQSSKSSVGSALRSSPEGQQIDATVQRLSAELNRVIFGAWNDIFGKKIQGRRINVEWHIDEGDGKEVYLEIYIVDGISRYYISDRSLGFRWFFSFLLFTQFQSKRLDRSQTVFLFDEPASHLHARAQVRLLQSFERIAEPNHVVVYSTHSHYLIDPLWLESAYIVVNSAFNFDEDDPNSELSDRRTNISAIKYKAFVSANPSKTTYFQPALDALDYAESPLSVTGPAIILEGKYDYYPFRYFYKRNDVNIYPGTGAGSMGYLISMLRAKGQTFCILLDGDAAGVKERQRYIDEFLLSEREVVTLGDLSSKLVGKAFESIFQEDVHQAVSEYRGGKTKLDKMDFYVYFQYIISIREAAKFSRTQKAFDKIALALNERILI